MSDTAKAQPGGWEGFLLEVSDLAGTRGGAAPRRSPLRGDIVSGIGGRQIQVEDPCGSPVGLFEPSLPEARLDAQ
jgi:hypothetical protein